MSIATAIQNAQAKVAAAYTACDAKGATMPKTQDLSNLANCIGSISSGGGGNPVAEENDVIFIDYDGTIRYSYSAADFANLTAMPANPTHQGLTAQGWNWTLAEAKAYVASYGKLVVGQMYITDDGKTRIYIHLEDGRLSPMLGIGLNGTAVVDWGDGTTSTITGSDVSTTAWTDTHNYASPGDYVIAISVDGSMCLNSCDCPLLSYSSDTDEHRNFVYRNSIQKIEIGSGVVAIRSDALSTCYSLQSITIPSGVTIGSTAFQSCSSLSSITIPSGVTGIDQTVFQYCNALSRVALPPSITNIGNYAFEKCYSLLGVTIPSGVTSIGSSAFINCWALSSLTIPAGATVNNNAFAYCYPLTKVVTQSGTIGSGEFRYCYSLTNVTIPSGVTSIGGNAFGSCWGLSKLYLLPTTPPTIATSSFSGTPADMVIYVPYSADHSILTAYQTATNWSNFASQMVEMPA